MLSFKHCCYAVERDFKCILSSVMEYNTITFELLFLDEQSSFHRIMFKKDFSVNEEFYISSPLK